MTWRVTYTRTFLKELVSLPAHVQKQVENIVFGDSILEDPFLGGKTQKLVGYHTYYKIRFGNYRVGLRIDIDTEQIEFQRVLHRREIYRKFP